MLLNSRHAPVTRDDRLVAFAKNQSFEVEQFRRLRHKLEELRSSRGVGVIAVTSAVAGDGKTLTSVNLAGVLAAARGVRVLLIDADLRRPNVARTLGITPRGGGLVHALERGATKVADLVQRVDDSSLDVVLCEPGDADAYDFLTSSAFRAILEDARLTYDYVIVDTPPVVPVPDSGLLGRVVDGYLVVVSAQNTPRKLLGEALSLLEPQSVIGLIYNRDKRPLFGYYASYYSHYFRPELRKVHRASA